MLSMTMYSFVRNVSGLSWFGAIVAVVSFIATVVAWISTDGVLLIAQIVLVGTGLAAIIADAVAVALTAVVKAVMSKAMSLWPNSQSIKV